MSTITRVYDTYSHANRVVTELESSGIPSKDISLVANKYVSDKYANVEEASPAATGAGVGAAIGGGAGLLAGLGLLAIPGLGPVVAAGWLASTAALAVAGGATGGLIGALTQSGVSEEDANVYAEGVRRGGTLVTARVPDAERTRCEAILDRASVNLRDRAALYQKSGWSRFDPAAPAYTEEQIRNERELYRRNP